MERQVKYHQSKLNSAVLASLYGSSENNLNYFGLIAMCFFGPLYEKILMIETWSKEEEQHVTATFYFYYRNIWSFYSYDFSADNG